LSEIRYNLQIITTYNRDHDVQTNGLKLSMLQLLRPGAHWRHKAGQGDAAQETMRGETAPSAARTLKTQGRAEQGAEMWEKIARRFEERWQFPHCIGALDGKHITITKPAKSGSSFFNYKQTFPVVLMAIVDADYKFVTIDVGSMGRFSDGSIFSS
jgi:hypothetical protein